MACDCEAKLKAALEVIQIMQEKARKGHDYWNKDQDSKVGKYLGAMAGYLPGYWPELDAALGKLKGGEA